MGLFSRIRGRKQHSGTQADTIFLPCDNCNTNLAVVVATNGREYACPLCLFPVDPRELSQRLNQTKITTVLHKNATGVAHPGATEATQ